MTDWRKQHGEVIAAFIRYLNEKTDKFVLKGWPPFRQTGIIGYPARRFRAARSTDGYSRIAPAALTNPRTFKEADFIDITTPRLFVQNIICRLYFWIIFPFFTPNDHI